MKYSEVRRKAQSGDLFLVKGWGPLSLIIRIFTAESFSHVAMLLWHDDGLYVHEMRGRTGYTITPASQWIYQIKGHVEFGSAPSIVHSNSEKLQNYVDMFRAKKYGWFALVSVWLSQVTKLKWPTIRKVCSTFTQAAWAACGWLMKGNADPGNMAENCLWKAPVERWDVKVLTSLSKMIKKLD